MTSLVEANTMAVMMTPSSSLQVEHIAVAQTTNTITDILKEEESAATETSAIIMKLPPPESTITPPPTPIPMKTTSTSTTTTRIPYPLDVSTSSSSSIVDASCNSPFQRSASMRVRGTKSNVIVGVPNTPANVIQPTNGQKQQSIVVTHDLSTTGGFSSRRKVALRSSLTRTGSSLLNQTTVAATTTTTTTSSLYTGHLTRSPSLQRSKYRRNTSYKTPATATTEQEQQQQQQQEKHYELLQEVEQTLETEPTQCAANKKQFVETIDNKELSSYANHNETLPDNMAASNGIDSIGPDEVDGFCTSKLRNMSLKLNGESNNIGTSPVNTSGTAVTKTPTCPRQAHCGKHHSYYQQHHQHSHQHQGSCTGGGGGTTAPGKLATVPETKLTPKTPPVTPDSPGTYLDDDLDSMYSFATTTSGRSTMSCEHPYVARNGTTFSGRKMKYVVHCSNYAGQVGPDYLTPTQRAQRQIKRLKELLCIARQDLEQKDSEMLRLTREVVELRLFKASLSSPEERSASSAVTVREAELKTSQDVSPIVDMVDEAAAAGACTGDSSVKASPRHVARLQQSASAMATSSSHLSNALMTMSSEMQSSYADSGNFEDITTSSVHSKDSHTHDIASGNDDIGKADEDDCEPGTSGANRLENYELQRQELIRMYEQRIEELVRTQDTAASDLKRSHNDKVEALLQKLAECNTRYADIVPDYEHAKERIRELEKQLEDLQRKLIEHEEKQNKMYLHMYQKGQEAERIARADQALELAHRQPDSKVSINELLNQLQSTQDELENIRAAECRMNECGSNHALLTAKEAISLWVLGARKTIYRRLLEAQKNRTHVDPEVTLQFLKSAVYYFLTDKENSQGHLQAIESILEFTESEKLNITKARAPK